MSYADKAKQQEYQRAWAKKARADRKTSVYVKREFIRQAKSVPCTDCKILYPYYVMDFDHVSGEKISHLKVMPEHYGLDTIKAEIAKCEVVCANCHRERTHQRSKHT